MIFALLVTAVVISALAWEIGRPSAKEWYRGCKRPRRPEATYDHDPGRERRAEQRARELLKSCVNQEEWEMYCELGLIRVWGRDQSRSRGRIEMGRAGDERDAPAPYAYLIYPHKPVVAYVPQTGQLISEYCVEFPDRSRPFGSARLPESDDVLAKWMALTGDERRLVASANMHLPGRQVDTKQVAGDLVRLGQWERGRLQRSHGSKVWSQ